MQNSLTRSDELLPKCKVYVIESVEALSSLEEKLKAGGPIIKANVMCRWDIDKHELVETKNKNIITCLPEVIERFKEVNPNYNNLVKDYNWATFPVPNQDKNETTNLHVTGIPNDFSQKEAESFVIKQLAPILSSDHFEVIFGLKSRQSGTIHGFGQIRFAPYVPKETIYLSKILLHHQKLPSKQDSKAVNTVTAVWHIDSKTEQRTSVPIATRGITTTRISRLPNVDLTKTHEHLGLRIPSSILRSRVPHAQTVTSSNSSSNSSTQRVHLEGESRILKVV